MKIETTNNYTLVKTEEKSFSDFLSAFKSEYKEISETHLIVLFSEEINTKIEDLLLLLDISVAHKLRKFSFICVADKIDIDEIPEELSVVPTMDEAEDVLEMDEIERDLGF